MSFSCKSAIVLRPALFALFFFCFHFRIDYTHNKPKNYSKDISYTFSIFGTDPEDLPQILPPKRRQRAPKSLSHQETRALSKPANLERIMADFPKHNWLFDKYNNVSKEDATGGCENKQVCYRLF